MAACCAGTPLDTTPRKASLRRNLTYDHTDLMIHHASVMNILQFLTRYLNTRIRNTVNFHKVSLKVLGKYYIII